MTNEICNDDAYKNMIEQKARFQLLNIPPVRYDNLKNNPYKQSYPNTNRNFTKFDLDMRRKVEILKYNATSTQTNQFTKSQLYAQAINGKYQQRTYSQSFISDNTVNNTLIKCPNVKTPTTACGIPGPVMYLYEDENVPLYNYNSNIDSNYGILTQGINPYEKTWDYTKEYDKKSINGSETNITSLFILYQDVPTKIFTIVTPVALEFSGSTTYNAASSTNPIIISFTITNAAFSTNLYYNNKKIITNSIINNSCTNRTITVTIDKKNSTTFYGKCYLGLLTISNIQLPIQKGFIYDIKSAFINNSSNNNNYINSLSVNAIFNISSNIPTPTNCTITNSETIPPTGFSSIYVTAI